MMFFPTSDDVLDVDPPAPDEDDWQGPEDAEPLHFCGLRCSICAEVEREEQARAQLARELDDESRPVYECGHRFPSKRCRFCAEGADE